MSILKPYNFYNKDWFIAAEVIKHYKLSTNYNTYYSKYYSNGRLYGSIESFEFRLSGTYLQEFIALYGVDNTSLSKSSAVWLIDDETVKKLLNRDLMRNSEKTVKTVESNPLSIKYNLGVDKAIDFSNTKHKVNLNNITTTKKEEPEYIVNPLFIKPNGVVVDTTNSKELTSNNTHIGDSISSKDNTKIEELVTEIANNKASFICNELLSKQQYRSSKEVISYSKYSEEEISDCITLLSSKLTNTPYQQEKLLEGGSIRLDLFSCTRRSIYAIELKKGLITLDMIKEKLETKHYLTSIINEYPDLNITFIFSSPQGISWEGLLYLQEASKSVGPHKIIYKPCSNLILDMINKKEKDLPSYYYKQILDKPIIKYLLQVS